MYNIINNRGTYIDLIVTKQLEEIVMELSKKKGTNEGIINDILKTAFYIIKNEFIDIINSSLRRAI